MHDDIQVTLYEAGWHLYSRGKNGGLELVTYFNCDVPRPLHMLKASVEERN